MLKYVISCETKFGAVSAESEDLGDLQGVYPELKEFAQKIEQKEKTQSRFWKKKRGLTKSGNIQRGRGETTRILRDVESKVLFTRFFSTPRTTGETQLRLRELTNRAYTSRKVSQALGILKNRGDLKRAGSRNSYRYWR